MSQHVVVDNNSRYCKVISIAPDQLVMAGGGTRVQLKAELLVSRHPLPAGLFAALVASACWQCHLQNRYCSAVLLFSKPVGVSAPGVHRVWL